MKWQYIYHNIITPFAYSYPAKSPRQQPQCYIYAYHMSTLCLISQLIWHHIKHTTDWDNITDSNISNIETARSVIQDPHKKIDKPTNLSSVMFISFFVIHQLYRYHYQWCIKVICLIYLVIRLSMINSKLVILCNIWKLRWFFLE